MAASGGAGPGEARNSQEFSTKEPAIGKADTGNMLKTKHVCSEGRAGDRGEPILVRSPGTCGVWETAGGCSGEAATGKS